MKRRERRTGRRGEGAVELADAEGLAHVLRNPINGAQLHLAFLERAMENGASDALHTDRREALEALGVVKGELTRIARLLTDFLDFARARPLNLGPTSVGRLFTRVFARVSSPPRVAAATLRLEMPTEDIALPADEDRLGDALVHLLHNAFEAASPSGGTVILRARALPRHVEIEVEDDGPGLPLDHHRVFDAFFSTKPHKSGLGLAIARRTVAEHGGTIDIAETRPGRTTFRIVLPSSAEGEGAVR